METIILEWFHVGPLDAFFKKTLDKDFAFKFSNPGIYFWVERTRHVENTDAKEHEQWMCNYIGKSRSSLIGRNLEHISSQLSLFNSIPKCYGTHRFVNRSPSKYTRQNGYDAVEFLSTLTDVRRDELVSAAVDYLKSIQLFFCPLKDDEKLTLIEKQLISDLFPVENGFGSGAATEYFKFTHSGSFTEELLKVWIANAKDELSRDKTRPYKRKC